MAKRRSFVPEDPSRLSLEERLAPSGDWFTHTYHDLVNRLKPPHHNQDAAAGIAQLWKNSDKLSRPTHALQPHAAQSHAARSHAAQSGKVK